MRPKRAKVGGKRTAGRTLCPLRRSPPSESGSSETGSGAAPAVDPVQVACRLRPANGAEQCIEQLDECTLQLTPPPDSQAFRNGTAKQQQYRFHNIFSDATQRTVFDSVARDLVRDLLTGKNGLLFAYGVTGSGKTYTMMGNNSDMGIIPRSLDMVFASLSDVQARRKVFRPDSQFGFQIRTEADAMLERQRELLSAPKTPAKRFGVLATPGTAKRVALQSDGGVLSTPSSGATGGGSSDSAGATAAPSEPPSLQLDCVDEDSAYAVFISYLEIYNSNVYDLLEEIPAENMRRELRVRQIREDTTNNRVWVQDLNEVEVCSLAEAMEVLKRGQRRRKVAHTTLNSESSRSHSVLTIRVVQAPLDARGDEVLSDPNTITVGQLSLVDLAGSERANRTKNQGDTLREAGSINKSLMALRCYIEARRSVQRNTNKMPVPNARNDKLTHLFKNYFDGEGRIQMIVCVNPRAEEYDETVNVMQFAELTQEVVVSRQEDKLNMAVGFTPGRRKANQLLREAQDRLGADAAAGVLLSDAELSVVYCLGPEWPSLYMSVDGEAELLQTLTRFLQRRSQSRATLCADIDQKQRVFRERLVRIELELASLRSENASLRQNSAAQQRHLDEVGRRLAAGDALNDSLTRRLRDAHGSQKTLAQELDDKQHRLNQEELERERVKQRMKTRLQREKERLALDANRLRNDRSQMRQELRARDDKLRALRNLINTDEEFVRPTAPPPPQQQQQASTAPPQPSPRITRSGRARADSDTALAATPQPKRLAPVASGRRRSKSMDAESWLDHRPGHVLQMATLFQPKMKKRKSVTKLEAKDVVNSKASKYVLTHQDVDSAGEVETHMVKGDMLPTVSGGRAVVFNDMETLRLSAPGASRIPSDVPMIDRAEIHNRCSTGIHGHASSRRKV